MPMSDKRWARIKQQVGLWFVMDADRLDPQAAAGVIAEMRNVLAEIIAAQEEPDAPLPWWKRLFARDA